MRIDSSGRLLVGTSTARSIVDTSTTQFETVVDNFSQGVSLLNHSVGGFYPNLRLALSRTNTQGGQGALNAGTGAGAISFAGSDGTTFRDTASITGQAETLWTSGDTPGRLLFATTPSGSALPVERMRIDSSGRLLVGTSTARTNFNPTGGDISAAIQVEGTTYSTSTLALTTNGAVAANNPVPLLLFNRSRGASVGSNTIVANNDFLGAVHFCGSDGVNFPIASRVVGLVDGAPGTNDMPGRLQFETTPSGSSNLLERMRIDSSGRVLVGTSTARTNFYGAIINPQVQIETANTATRALSIVSSASVDAGGLLVLAAQKSGAVGGNTIVALGNELGQIGFLGSDGTNFQPGALIRSFVDSAPSTSIMPGRLQFEVTDGAGFLLERMRIDNTGKAGFLSGDNTVWTSSTAAAGTTQSIFVGSYSATAPYGGTVSIVIRTNGNVLNTNGSYGAISDLKLKENIVDANSQWDDLKALQVRNYNFKEGQTHTQIGLIAQEVELVSPGLVNESPDRDEEGNDLGTVTKSVAYSVLYMKAVKALQEAMERIEVLEAKVTVLEAA